MVADDGGPSSSHVYRGSLSCYCHNDNTKFYLRSHKAAVGPTQLISYFYDVHICDVHVCGVHISKTITILLPVKTKINFLTKCLEKAYIYDFRIHGDCHNIMNLYSVLIY